LLDLFFDPEDGGDMFLQNVAGLQWTTGHYIPKIELFVTIAVKILNPIN
jgi:hypothetical protein